MPSLAKVKLIQFTSYKNLRQSVCDQWIISTLHVLWISWVLTVIKSVRTCKTFSHVLCLWENGCLEVCVCVCFFSLATQYPHCRSLLFEQQMEPTNIVWIQFSAHCRCHFVPYVNFHFTPSLYIIIIKAFVSPQLMICSSESSMFHLYK